MKALRFGSTAITTLPVRVSPNDLRTALGMVICHLSVMVVGYNIYSYFIKSITFLSNITFTPSRARS